MITVEFYDMADGRSVVTGPFEWAQITYNVLIRVSDDNELASANESGRWVHKGIAYSDVILLSY